MSSSTSSLSGQSVSGSSKNAPNKVAPKNDNNANEATENHQNPPPQPQLSEDQFHLPPDPLNVIATIADSVNEIYQEKRLEAAYCKELIVKKDNEHDDTTTGGGQLTCAAVDNEIRRLGQQFLDAIFRDDGSDQKSVAVGSEILQKIENRNREYENEINCLRQLNAHWESYLSAPETPPKEDVPADPAPVGEQLDENKD